MSTVHMYVDNVKISRHLFQKKQYAVLLLKHFFGEKFSYPGTIFSCHLTVASLKDALRKLIARMQAKSKPILLSSLPVGSQTHWCRFGDHLQ